MPPFLHPLLHKNHNEHSRHNEIQPRRVKMDKTAEQTADRRAADPIKLIEKGHKEIKPAPVNVFRDFGSIIDAECFVAHGVDQVIFFRAEIFIFIQHGNAVKQMARLNHERHQKCLHGRKRGEQHAHGDKFQTSTVDHGAQNHRIPEGKSGRAHLNAIGHRKEPEARENRHGIGKRRAQRGEFAVFHDFECLLQFIDLVLQRFVKPA